MFCRLGNYYYYNYSLYFLLLQEDYYPVTCWPVRDILPIRHILIPPCGFLLHSGQIVLIFTEMYSPSHDN